MESKETGSVAAARFGWTGLLHSVVRLWSYLRLTPFDTSTPEGRSKERYRRAAWTSLAGMATNGVRVCTSLISVRLAVGYLGVERFGLWMTISSVISLLSFTDLGIGNGLLNAISEANGRDDRDAARRYVSGAVFMLSGIALCLAVCFATVYCFVPWPRVFNVASDVAVRESGPAVAVFFACFVVGLPLGIAERVQIGYQEGFTAQLWAMLGAVMALGALWVAIHLHMGLPWLVLAMSGASALAMLLNSMVLFGKTHAWLFPKWDLFDSRSTWKIIGTGLLFLVLQVLTLLVNCSDNLIIAHVLGPSSVAGYAVVFKLFSVTLIAQYVVNPLWPAFGEAMARKDFGWARRTLDRAVVFSLTVGVLTAVPLMLLGKWIVGIWVGPHLIPSTSLLVGYGLWVLLVNYGGVMTTFLNSGALVGRQIAIYGAASVTALILKVVLVASWGVAGAVWATIMGFGVFYVVPALKLAYGGLHEAEKQSVCVDSR